MGVVLWLIKPKKKKLLAKIFGALSFLLGLFGLLQALGILSGVPVLALGIPAVLSVYFDVFSGCIQAYIFAMLTMLNISGAYPADAIAERLAKREARKAKKAKVA